jgi:trehalose 6-phosphate synthase
MGETSRLLTVSNRGPVEYRLDEAGRAVPQPGQGGLSTALRVAANLHPTTWLSSPLTDIDREIATGTKSAADVDGASRFVATDPEAYNLFYGCFSNEVLWFLQHGMPWPDELIDSCRLDHAWEKGYLTVNRAFADAVVHEMQGASVRGVMFHDYHFYTAPRLVRQQAPGVYLQHFVHIPWPGAETWTRLEATIVETIVDGVLGNDSLVFQTSDSARNFLDTVKAFVPGALVDDEAGTVIHRGQETRVWSNGISVDPEELLEAAATPDFSRYRYLLRPSAGQKTIVRVDRADLTKNIIAGFKAYERVLEDHPEMYRQVQFIAHFVPSRSDIPSYKRYQDEAQALAESINQRFGSWMWKPIRVFFEHNRLQAIAAMSLYDVMLVNPIADGMNLVAKEGPIVNVNDGVLVLSKRAGAYEDLNAGAIGIDPEDIEQTAGALYRALTMPAGERSQRAAALRRAIQSHDLHAWFSELLADIEKHSPLTAITAA